MNLLAKTDAPLVAIVTRAVREFRRDIEVACPFATQALDRLLTSAPGRLDPVSACLSVRSFPLVALPVWLGRAMGGPLDDALQVQIARSSLHGYYFVRLVDNVMDGDASAELAKVLPASGVFLSFFQRIYQPWFAHDDRFWGYWEEHWHQSCDLTVRDAFLKDISLVDFHSVCQRKFEAAKIPLAAVACRSGRQETLGGWFELVDVLGCWYQMANDVFDWLHDYQFGIRTYFLGEGERCRWEGEPLASWVAREGFAWGIGQLEVWMSDLKRRAIELSCPDLLRALQAREVALGEQIRDAEQALAMIRALAAGTGMPAA